MANQKLGACGFHHIALCTSDFEKSMEFYVKGLGFEVYRAWKTDTGRSIALLDFGNGTMVEIFSDGVEKDEYPAEYAGCYFHLALATADAEAAFCTALSAGAEVHKNPQEYTLPANPPIHAKIAFVKGPDGELIEFFQTLN